MLNRTDIRRECHRNTFEKAEALSERGAVHNLSWESDTEDGFEIIRMSASVQGSGGNLYAVEIEADEDYREILQYECTCPAFYSYSGLCKHCAAVLLTYLRERGAAGRRRRFSASGSMSMQPVVRNTTYGFTEVLNRYVMRDKVNLLQQGVLGTVRLEPHFKCYGESLRAEFKIGSSRMYVLKNIGDFVNAMAQRADVSYGKELYFYHDLEAFAPECRPLVKFLVFSLLKGNSGLGNYLSSVYKRELPVSGDMLDDFLESVGELPLYGEVDGSGEKRWEFAEGWPKRVLEIVGEQVGITVQLEGMKMLTGRRRVYFLENGRIWKCGRDEAEEIQEFLNYMDGFGRSGLYVAKAELPAFTRDLLPILSEHFEVKIKGFEPAEYLPEQAVYEIYLDAPQRELLTCMLYAVYGEEKYNLFEAFDATERRDTRQEMKVSGAVSSFFNAYDPDRRQMVIDGEGEIYEFLREGLPRLQELCEVYVSDAVKAIRLLPAPRVNVGISLSGDLLELTVSSEEMPLEQLVQILSRYDRKRKYFRLKDGSFVDLSDDGLRVLREVTEQLGITGGKLKEGKAELPKYRAMYLDGQLAEGAGMGLYKDRAFRSLVRKMKTVEDGDYEIPGELLPILRGYQKTGFLWIKTLKENGFGGILADDMGLGKTLQVIAFLLAEWRAEPEGGASLMASSRLSLVVCPASLVYNWRQELLRFAPELPVYLAAGSAAARQQVLEESGEEKKGVLITSYDLLRRDIDLYEGLRFDCQIIDEAQFIKNHTTQAARAVKAVQAGFRLALTGTPVENRLSELWSIFDYLMPGFLFPYARFRDEVEAPIVNRNDEAAAERLQKMVRPFILRRLKQDVLSDLPDKIEKNMYAAMEGEQQELYDAHVQRLVQVLGSQTEQEYAASRIQVLAELTKLRQLCCDPGLLFEGYQGGSAKTALCLELIRNASDGGHKVLLFSQFTSMLERLKEAMRQEGISFFSLDGSTPKAKRLELVERFNADDTQVFCISLKAGGTGLNLTGADMVIHFDPWWNAAVQNQATDRAHRIGQKNVVTVYRLIAKGSIEEKIVALQEKKKELAEQILGQEGMGMAALTKEALMEILG